MAGSTESVLVMAKSISGVKVVVTESVLLAVIVSIRLVSVVFTLAVLVIVPVVPGSTVAL